jgi:hypothetical protein
MHRYEAAALEILLGRALLFLAKVGQRGLDKWLQRRIPRVRRTLENLLDLDALIVIKTGFPARFFFAVV